MSSAVASWLTCAAPGVSVCVSGGARNSPSSHKHLPPLLVCSESSDPFISSTSPSCGITTLCPVSCCSRRTAPRAARTHIAPGVSNPTSKSCSASPMAIGCALICGVYTVRIGVCPMWMCTVPLSSATVTAPAAFSIDKCAGPQIVISPPSTRSIRAVPDFTRTSLPLRSTVFTCPCTTSTLIGPLTAIVSPSITPMLSAGSALAAGWSPALAPAAPAFVPPAFVAFVLDAFVFAVLRFAIAAVAAVCCARASS